MAANADITAATKTKITYDAKGLVTAGADATTADIAASTDKNYVTDAELTVLQNTSNTNTGDQTLTGLGMYKGVYQITTTGSSVIISLSSLPSAPTSLNANSAIIFSFRNNTSVWVKSSIPTDTDGDGIDESINLVFNNNTNGTEIVSYIIVN